MPAAFGALTLGAGLWVVCSASQGTGFFVVFILKDTGGS